MSIKEWLEENAELVPSDLSDSMAWVTKSRGDYITLDCLEKDLSHLEGLTYVSSIWEAGKPVCIGFNPAEQKWYGWPHRAMYGFGIGSTCKKGDIHYRPVDKDDFLRQMVEFWEDEDRLNIHGEHRENGVYIEWEYSDNIPNEDMRGEIRGSFSLYPDEYGRGEWEAKTLADARQMAIDFAESVS